MDDGCIENNSRGSSRNGGYKPQSTKKRRQVVRFVDTGETCNNRARASIVKSGIKGCPSVVGGGLEDANETPTYHILEGSGDNSLEDEADSKCDTSLTFHNTQPRYRAIVSGGKKKK